jgi:hypothetical protein
MAETRLAVWFVRQIGLLYAVEKQLREQKAGPPLRQAMRVWQAQPVSYSPVECQEIKGNMPGHNRFSWNRS